MASLTERRVLVGACGAHLIQDGLVALQYVMLPILAQAFGLNYAQVGFLRAVSSSSMTLLEIPAGMMAERCGEIRLLAFGLVCAGLGYIGVALADSFFWIVFGFLVAGCGAAFQHSLASALIADAFDDSGRRRALGIYNACGDAGKLAFTAVFSLLIGAGLAWDQVLFSMGLIAPIFVLFLLRLGSRRHRQEISRAASDDGELVKTRWGILQPRRFAWLGLTVCIDSLVQAVFLTFIAFVLIDKGASATLASLAVVLVLSGGMVGKFASGFLAVRFGDLPAFIILQLVTIAGLLLVVALPALPTLALLPLIGVALQGSSTVTYGVVADFVQPGRQSRGYALIYAISGVAIVIGPLVFGWLADLFGLDWSMMLLAILTGFSVFTARVLRRPVRLAVS